MLSIVVLLALLNLRDYFAVKRENYGSGKTQLPGVLRRISHKFIKKFSAVSGMKVALPFSFALGIIIAAGEFLCTGQVYLATIIYVLQSGTHLGMHAFLYFALYSTAFILPLLVLVFLVYKGRELFEVSEVIREKLPLIKLVTAIFFAVYGAFVWFVF